MITAKPHRPRGVNHCKEFKWRDFTEVESHFWPGPMVCSSCKYFFEPECPFNFKIDDATAEAA